MNSYHRWRRGVNRRLSPHFTTAEFTCHCGICAEQRISENLINLLEEIREDLGGPLKVNDGFRCTSRQARLRDTLPLGHTAKGRSTHEDGEAADITAPDLDRLKEICQARSKAVGLANTFVHVDTRRDAKRLWRYT